MERQYEFDFEDPYMEESVHIANTGRKEVKEVDELEQKIKGDISLTVEKFQKLFLRWISLQKK